MTTQISELGLAQRRSRTAALDSDRAAVTTVGPVAKITLTQHEACASLGCSDEFFMEHVWSLMRVARWGCKRRFAADELRVEVAERTLWTGQHER